jgi:hypothetical protein
LHLMHNSHLKTAWPSLYYKEAQPYALTLHGCLALIVFALTIAKDVDVHLFPADRCATDAKHPDLTFVLRNNCDGTPWELTVDSVKEPDDPVSAPAIDEYPFWYMLIQWCIIGCLALIVFALTIAKDVDIHLFPADWCATDANHPDLTFVLQNNCDGTPWELTATTHILLSYYISYQQIKFDEDEQTAQDYSVKISNPSKDTVDPDKWFHFFHDNCDGAHVTVITIARNNDLLVRTLVKRRELLRTINNMQEGESSMKMLDLARVG